MKTLLTLLTLVIFAFPHYVHAQINYQLDIEAKLQEKIRSVISSFDPDAQVVVNVSVRQITATLPGSGIRVENYLSSSTLGSFSSDDITSVDIQILTRMDSVPASLQSLIVKSINLPKIRPKIQFDKMDSVVKTAIQKREIAKLKPSPIDRTELNPIILYSMSILGALLLGLVGITLFVTKKILQTEFSKLNQTLDSSLSQSSQAVRLESNEMNSQRESNTLLAKSDTNTESIRKMNTHGLVALISDCYWCEEDHYASWLWNQILPDQKFNILNELPWVSSYISGLPTDSEIKGFHQHPYYLMPQKISRLSQDDLKLWLKKYPTAWHFISPMRQSKIMMPIFEKIELSQLPKPQDPPVLPATVSETKFIPPQINISEISFEDELSILNDPSKIPVSVRSQIKSLVWLVLLPQPQQDEILAQVSAQQLANAWIGPLEILNQLAAKIGEKKLKLLEDYIKTAQASRNSVVMQFLVQEALKKTAVVEPIQEDQKSAA